MELQSILTLEPARRALNSSYDFIQPHFPLRLSKEERDVELASWIYYYSWTLRSNTHTLGLRASISLSLIFQGNSVLCCCAVLSSSCPSFSLKGAIVSSKCLMLMSTKTFCYSFQLLLPEHISFRHVWGKPTFWQGAAVRCPSSQWHRERPVGNAGVKSSFWAR